MSANEPNPFAIFGTGNLLDAPKRGKGEPNEAALLIGRLAMRGISLAVADKVRIVETPQGSLTQEDCEAINAHALDLLRILDKSPEPRSSLEEQAEQEKAHALQFIGREPTAKESAEAKAKAAALLEWLDKHWHGSLTLDNERDRAMFFHGLKWQLYSAGVISLCWGLDRPSLLRFLAELRRIEDKAGPDFLQALNEAQRKEAEEWLAIAEATRALARQAQILNSPRLEQAAALMAGMLTPDRVRPEAVRASARKESAATANQARSKRREAIWERVEEEMEIRLNAGMKAVNARAEVGELAYEWNRRAPASPRGGAPFSWKSPAEAAEAIRTHYLKKRKPKK